MVHILETESGKSSAASLMQELKGTGIESLLVRRDGILIHSTVTLDEHVPSVASSLANVSDAMVKSFNDEQKEIELMFDGIYFVILPLGNYLLCGIVKDRETKKEMRSCAENLKALK
ncbi:TPA: roadblock/LC7 domain-containing protein [Candidatus Micrarchaeota archaeon]|nr:roadblock/LC7 domain-containing protein [Candidatus Micrarchaeota archaeon]